MGHTRVRTMHVCDYCGREYKSRNGVAAHERWCQCWHCKNVRHAEDPEDGVGKHVRDPGCRLLVWDKDWKRNAYDLTRQKLPKRPPECGTCALREPNYAIWDRKHSRELQEMDEAEALYAINGEAAQRERWAE